MIRLVLTLCMSFLLTSYNRILQNGVGIIEVVKLLNIEFIKIFFLLEVSSYSVRGRQELHIRRS